MIKNVPCFKCRKKFEEHDYYMVGLDRPYVNLFFHWSCYAEVESELLEFIQENLKDYLDLWFKIYNK